MIHFVTLQNPHLYRFALERLAHLWRWPAVHTIGPSIRALHGIHPRLADYAETLRRNDARRSGESGSVRRVGKRLTDLLQRRSSMGELPFE